MIPSSARAGLLALLILAVPSAPIRADEQTAEGRHGMVVCVSPPAASVGVEVLRQGGNAVDAAVAVAFAQAVTYPAAGNIGGGGFMLVHPADRSPPVVIDYREVAPAAASKTMYAKDESWYTARAVGVPGTVRGLALAHQKFGKLPWKAVVQPAARLAAEGFLIDARLASSLNNVVAGSADFPELRRVLGKDGGAHDWHEGDTLVQKDLGHTLMLIAEQGADAFYTGEVAGLLAAEMKASGGLITRADLEGYQARAREPIHGTYRGHDIYGPPPPSSGGICLVEMLNVLEDFDLRKQGRYSAETLHVMIEAMRRAYCDRARYLGDPDFAQAPARLTSRDYARELARGIDLHKATPSADLAPELQLAREGTDTTHFSVIDQDGMAVANTYTLERSYGSRIVVRGAGFVLNNEMIDFNWQPGVTDRRGTIGTEPNQIAPGKRMLSSQTPTIVARDGKVELVTGSPGSRTIINTVLGIVVNVIDFDMSAREAVDAPRMHHAWFPDEVRFEGITDHAEAIEALRKMGHVVVSGGQGDAHTIRVDPRTGMYHGAADRRVNGKALGY